jgi:hypothetical protein
MLDADHPDDGFTQEQPCCRGRVVLKGGSPRLGVDKEEHNHPANCEKPCCRRHLVDMLGRGRKEFPIPSKQKVLQDISQMIAQGKIGALEGLPDPGDGPVSVRKRARGIRTPGTDLSRLLRRMVKGVQSPDDKSQPGSGAQAPSAPAKGAPTAPARTRRKLKSNANAQRVAAEVIRLRFHDERWKAAVAKKFNQSRGVLRRARKQDARYQQPIASLDQHFEKLRQLYTEALPDAYDLLKKQYPNASDGELRAAAQMLLDQQEELAQILYVLDHYVMAFEQLEDPEYEPLLAVTSTVEEAFNLFLTGDIEAARGKARQVLADTVNFTIGNCFLPHAGEDGPATIPGASGPVGLHLILVPEDEVGIIMLMMVLYLHEFRHDVFADIKGLADEESVALLKKLKEAHASGRIKLSAEAVTLGKTRVPLIDLISKVFLDNLPEIDADMIALEMCGWAFALNMLYVFGAFNSKREGAIKTKELLRVSSYFQVSKKGELWFESHPVDYFRVYLLAAAMELQGFPEAAQVIRELADAAVGSRKPEFIYWEDMTGRRDPIKIRMSDLIQCAPVVVEAILTTPFPALKGKCNRDIVSWTPKRQDKVDALVDVMIKYIKSVAAGQPGKLELPAGIGDIYATYVAAAAAITFYQLISDGELEPAEVPQLVNQTALGMLALSLQCLKNKQQASGGGEQVPSAGDKPASGAAPSTPDNSGGTSPASGKPVGLRSEEPTRKPRTGRKSR